MIETSIIVPVHDDKPMVERCITSVNENTDNYELIFVVDKRVSFIEELKSYGTVVVVNKPFVFANRINEGVKKAKGEYLCFLNDDTVVSKGWLYQMVQTNRKMGDGIVSASCNVGGCRNTEAKSNLVNVYTNNTINMFATLIPRRVWDVVGDLDEAFIYYGGEDDDYSLRAIRHGFPLIVSDGFVHHEVGMGKDEECRKLLPLTDNVFIDKWGVTIPYKTVEENWYDALRKRSTVPLVSVMMPTKGHKDYIMASINSVLTQTHGNIELLIGVDGDEETFELIKDFDDRRVKVIYDAEGMGSCNMKNELFVISKGEFLAFHDSDDIMIANKLELQLKEMKPDIDIVTAALYEVKNGAKNKVATLPVNKHLMLYRNLCVAGSNFLMRRNVMERALFDEAYARGNDFEFVLRNYDKFKFRFLDKPVLEYNRHEGEHLSGNTESIKLHAIIRSKYIGEDS